MNGMLICALVLQEQKKGRIVWRRLRGAFYCGRSGKSLENRSRARQKYGIMHYAENGGPAALFHTARNLAQIMPIIKDMEALCPNAYLLNFTNPVPRVRLQCIAIHPSAQLAFVISSVLAI